MIKLQIVDEIPCKSELRFPEGKFFRREYTLLKIMDMSIFGKTKYYTKGQYFVSNLPLDIFATFLWVFREMNHHRPGESMQYPKRLVPYIDSIIGMTG